MQVTARTHIEARLQSTIFTILIVAMVGLLAWLSHRYEIKADWTVNNRHSLSEASQKLLDEMPDSIVITAYASNDSNLRQAIRDMVERYQQHKSDISLRFIDPFTVPNEVRKQGIKVDGELLIDYQDRIEHVRRTPPNEQELTSALQRAARSEKRLLVFLEGHGERSSTKFEDHDLSNWVGELKDSGFEVQSLNFGEQPNLPENAKVLVIASPRNELLPGEIALISDYIDQGGNLFWMIDPSTSLKSLEPLNQKLGLTIQTGIIVDPMSQLFGVNNPAVVSVATTGYGNHPITSGLEEYLTLFPHASGLNITPPENEDWLETPILSTNEKAWAETGELEGTIEYSEETDIGGPLDIAFALERNKPQIEMDEASDENESASDPKAETASEEIPELDDTQESSDETSAEIAGVAEDTLEADDSEEIDEEPVIQEQRIIVVGEGDFLSNAFIGYGGNLDLGINMINWLAEDDSFINIPRKAAVDLNLELSSTAVIWLGAFFLLILPFGLISIGISIWLRRRKG